MNEARLDVIENSLRANDRWPEAAEAIHYLRAALAEHRALWTSATKGKSPADYPCTCAQVGGNRCMRHGVTAWSERALVAEEKLATATARAEAYWPYVEAAAKHRTLTANDEVDALEMLRERKRAALASLE